jgi:hypothetical protein
MPDTLKQFYNATIDVTGLTGNQTATLFTNNSTTRAVIKDIAVANTFPVTPNLTVGGTPTAGLSSNLTGSEIVDVSQAVAMSFPTPLSFTSSLLIYLEGTFVYRFITGYNINQTQVNSAVISRGVTSRDGSATFVSAVYYAPDGDVFSAQSDGDLNWFLFKNAGSAGGTRTTINTGNTNTNSAIAFDGVNTFYWLSSTTNLRAFNADTETTTNTTIDAMPTASTRARLIHSNGYLFYVHAQANFVHLIEIATGRWILFNATNAAGNWNTTPQMPGFWFEPSTRVATMMFYNSASGGFSRNISPAIPVLTTSSTSLGTAWTTAFRGQSFNNGQISTANAHIVLSSADGGVTLDSSSLPRILSGLSGHTAFWTLSPDTLSNIASVDFRPNLYSYPSPTVNTTNFPNTISLRVTGVEVTL